MYECNVCISFISWNRGISSIMSLQLSWDYDLKIYWVSAFYQKLPCSSRSNRRSWGFYFWHDVNLLWACSTHNNKSTTGPIFFRRPASSVFGELWCVTATFQGVSLHKLFSTLACITSWFNQHIHYNPLSPGTFLISITLSSNCHQVLSQIFTSDILLSRGHLTLYGW